MGGHDDAHFFASCIEHFDKQLHAIQRESALFTRLLDVLCISGANQNSIIKNGDEGILLDCIFCLLARIPLDRSRFVPAALPMVFRPVFILLWVDSVLATTPTSLSRDGDTDGDGGSVGHPNHVDTTKSQELECKRY